MADVTEANLSFTLRSAHPRCNFRPHLGKFAKGGEYEDAGQSAGVQFDGRPNKQDMSNPTGGFWEGGEGGSSLEILANVEHR